MGARALSNYEAWDREAEGSAEARVVNVSPFVARFEVATVPGTRPRRYKLNPGESVHLQAGYVKEFKGAGREMVRATIESLTEREVFPKGRTLPMVVNEAKAQEMAQRWRDELAKGAEPPKPMEVSLPAADGGEPIKMTVTPAAMATNDRAQALAASVPRFDDDEDQAGGPMDDPPPDHNEPDDLPVVTAPAPKGRRGG